MGPAISSAVSRIACSICVDGLGISRDSEKGREAQANVGCKGYPGSENS